MGAKPRMVKLGDHGMLTFRARLLPALRTGVLTVLALAAAACQSPEAAPLSPGPPVAATSYRLGAGDHIRIITFGEERLSGEFTVSELGVVSLPLIGTVKAGGLTIGEFSDRVEGALAQGFLKNPRVSVEVLNYRPFYILGEVGKPGEYPFTNGLTVTNAVAAAGGFTYRANTHRVFIRAQDDAREHVAPLTSTTPVHPGDTIRIPERIF